MSTLSNIFANLLSKSSARGPVELPQAEDEPLAKGPSETCELRIEGMTCSACVEVRFRTHLPPPSCSDPLQSIEGMLRKMPGIHSVRVALLAERGVVEYDPTDWNPEKIINVSPWCSSSSSYTHRVWLRKYLISASTPPKYPPSALIPSTSAFMG